MFQVDWSPRWLSPQNARFFLCGGPQFEISSSIGRKHDLIGIAAGSNMIDIDDCERKSI